MNMVHVLKTSVAFFPALASGAKTFEVRKHDRDYKVGDMLRLKEYKLLTDEYTGREAGRIVTYVLSSEAFPGITPGWCVLGLKLLPTVTTEAPDMNTISNCLKQLATNVRNEPVSSKYKRGNRFAEKSISPNVYGE